MIDTGGRRYSLARLSGYGGHSDEPGGWVEQSQDQRGQNRSGNQNH